MQIVADVARITSHYDMWTQCILHGILFFFLPIMHRLRLMINGDALREFISCSQCHFLTVGCHSCSLKADLIDCSNKVHDSGSN